MVDEASLQRVVAEFCNNPATCIVRPLGSGNINDTYLIQAETHSFVLQRINSDVFPDPLRVIGNFPKISSHLGQQGCGEEKPLQVASPVYTLGKSLYYQDSTGAFWRGQSYLPHTSCQVLAGPAQARQVGRGLANFHERVADLDMQGLLDPLPGFHDLARYLEEYDQELLGIKTVDHNDLKEDFRFCLTTVDRYRQQATTLENAKSAGVFTLQPIHGDPKVDNFIFGEQGEVIGLLDLDTVATGLVHYDLGDCLRSCCNRMGERGRDAQPVTFDLTFCQALLDGYFDRPGSSLSEEQRLYVFDGLLHICFELGIRFFTDHLRGNAYFKVEQQGDNLLRAVNQFRLTADIVVKEQQIRIIAASSGVS